MADAGAVVFPVVVDCRENRRDDRHGRRHDLGFLDSRRGFDQDSVGLGLGLDVREFGPVDFGPKGRIRPGGDGHQPLALLYPATELSQQYRRGGEWKHEMMHTFISPVLKALSRGYNTLVYCKNGRHRSNQLCQAIIVACGVLPDDAANFMSLRRNLVEHNYLPGPPHEHYVRSDSRLHSRTYLTSRLT